MQTDLFIHGKENNNDSQIFYDKNKTRLSGQAVEVYRHLIKGNQLSNENPIFSNESYKTVRCGHLPRRIADIKEVGFLINSIRKESGFVTYFMSKENIEFNRELEKKITFKTK